MAVARQELNRTTYQDNQIKLLSSINSSMMKSLRVSEDIYDSMTSLPKVLEDVAEELSDSLSRSLKGIDGAMQRRYSTASNGIHRFSQELEDLGDQIVGDYDDIQDEIEENTRSIFDSLESAADSFKSKLSTVGNIAEFLGISLQDIIRGADGYSDILNSLMTYTGYSMKESQNLRDSMTNIVNTLNDRTGGKFRGIDVLDQMVSLSNATGLSNYNTLTTIMEPSLIAQKSMNADIHSISELFTKFYKRYSFSSDGMEEIVDYLRGITAGSDVDPNEILASYKANLETIYGARAYSLNVENPDAYITNALKAFANVFTYMESNSIDSTNFVDILTKLAGEEEDKIAAIQSLNAIGIDATSIDIDTQEGIMRLAEQYIRQSAAKYGEIASAGTGYAGMFLSNYGMDLNAAREAYIAVSKGLPTLEEFLANVPEDYSAAETISEMYKSPLDEFRDELQTKLFNVIATIQEDLGVGLGDVTAILSLLGTVYGAEKGMSLVSLLSKSGLGIGAVGAGAAGLGVVALLYSIYKGLKDSDVIKEQGAQAALSGIQEGVQAGTSYGFDSTTGLVQGKAYNPEDIKDYYWNLISANYEKSGLTRVDSVGSFFSNIGKGAIGSGWFSNGQADWTDYLPLWIGSAIRGVSDLTTAIDTKGTVKDTEKYLKYINNMTEEQASIFNAYKDLYPSISNKDQLTRLLYFIDNEAKIMRLFNEGQESWLEAYERGDLKGYATGTNYIDRDQVAVVHEGEAITPKKYNPAANLNILERLQAEQGRQEDLATEESMQELIDTIKDIKEFMRAWKTENDQKSKINSATSILRNKLLNSNVSVYDA